MGAGEVGCGVRAQPCEKEVGSQDCGSRFDPENPADSILGGS